MSKNKKTQEVKKESPLPKPYSDIMKCERGYFTRQDENICTRRYFKSYKEALEAIKR